MKIKTAELLRNILDALKRRPDEESLNLCRGVAILWRSNGNNLFVQNVVIKKGKMEKGTYLINEEAESRESFLMNKEGFVEEKF